MKDYLVRGMSMDGFVKAVAIRSTELVRRGAEIQKTSPNATAAFGRCLTAASMMGNMQKVEDGSMTLQVRGGGPIGTITVVSDSVGNVRGCVTEPRVPLVEKYPGKLDVGATVGTDGTLTVIRDLQLKEPYVGQIPLVSGNIAEDITAYYSISEQIPTVCALGIVFNENATIKAAGGYMLQLVPPVQDSAVKVIEDNLNKMESITGLLEKGLRPDELAVSALEGLGGEILDQWDAVYYCDCSRERTERILISLGREELQKLVDEGETTEVCCHFCNKKYEFSTAELAKLLKEQKN